MTKIGRNQPCPCGSAKKYKHCCGSLAGMPRPQPAPPEMVRALDAHYARERIRQEQQGFGKPGVRHRTGRIARFVARIGNMVRQPRQQGT